MAFFQNVTNHEFRGSWLLGDQQYSLTFRVPPNVNSSNAMVAYNYAPYDFSTLSTLTFNYSIDQDNNNYNSIAINIAGATPSATTADEVVAALNANTEFSSRFQASKTQVQTGAVPKFSVMIKCLVVNNNNVKAYISNSGAESLMRFNKKAGVSELPSYFERHTIANRFNFSDCTKQLVKLNPADPIDAAIITDAGFNPSSPKEDWEFLNGQSNLFKFQKITLDGSGRLSEVLIYLAGSKEGGFAKKIEYQYTGANINPDQITEVPHTLQTGDLINP